MDKSLTHGAPAGHEALSISWLRPAGMVPLSFTNMLLRMITIGIYHFWAKTEVRQRIWSAIRINDEPLTYTGRGFELFLGFLVVAFAVFLPVVALFVVLAFTVGPNHWANHVATLVVYVVFGFLFGLAIYRAQRYRLSRTRWRGIRGSLVGNPMRYAWTFFWTAALVPLTLGWIMPWRSTKLQSIISNDIRFGDRPVRFDARSGPLYGPFALAWIGGIVIYLSFLGGLALLFFQRIRLAVSNQIPFIPTPRDIAIVLGLLLLTGVLFGIVSAWYQARTINHFARHTHFENASFNGRLTARGLIWLSITNFLIMIAGGLLFGLLVAAVAIPFVDFASPGALGHPAIQVALSFIPLAIILGFSLFGPVIQARSTGYLIRNLSITGTAPLDEIAQAAATDIRLGEGLAEAFDIDAV